MPELRMPSLGADMEAGTLVAWRCAPGDPVRRGEIVAEVETDKGVIEVEAFEGGVVDALLVPPGTKVPVGTSLLRLRQETSPAAPPAPVPEPVPEPVPALTPPPALNPALTPSPSPAPSLSRFPPSIRQRAREEGVDPLTILERRFPHPPHAAPAAPSTSARARVSPRARRRAAELGVDLSSLTGTAPDGAITTDDVERASRRPPPERAAAPPAPELDRNAAMRRAIAASMERSNREIPHYWVSTTIDVSRALAWLGGANASRGVEARLVPAVLFLKATALALRRAPELNGFWQEGALRPSEHVHLGVAVSLRGGGLVAPAIHDADRLSLDALASALGDLVARARQGRLRSSEFTEATCTVTSLGERGVESVTPRIAPPQVAMLGLGRIARVPLAIDDRVEVRPTVHATLAGDHRATDGHRGAAFLVALGRLLQRPEEL